MIRKSTIGLIASALIIALSACAGGPMRDRGSSSNVNPNDSVSVPGNMNGPGGTAARSGDDSGGDR